MTWSSSAGGVATIDTDGKATGVSSGETSIEAELDGITGSATLYVSNAVPTGLTISGGAASIADGTTTSYTLTVDYSDGTSLNQTSAATWSSSNDTFASVQSPGVLRGESPTTTDVTVTAEYLGLQATTTLEVTAAVIASIEVTGATTLYDCLTYEYVATAIYSNGDTQDATKSVVWSSSYTPAATISNDTDTEGVVTPVAAGQTIISATLVNSLGETLIADLTVTVKEAQDLVLTSGSHTFDTDTGELDGALQEGWDAFNQTLCVRRFEIPSGSTLVVSGNAAFTVSAVEDILVDDSLSFQGTDGTTGANGGDIALSACGDITLTSSAALNSSGGTGSVRDGGSAGKVELSSGAYLSIEGMIEAIGGGGGSNGGRGGSGGNVTLTAAEVFDIIGVVDSSGGDAGAGRDGASVGADGQDGGQGGKGGTISLVGTTSFEGAFTSCGGNGGAGGNGNSGASEGGIGGNGGRGGYAGSLQVTGSAASTSASITLCGGDGGRGGNGGSSLTRGGDGGHGADGGNGGNFISSATGAILDLMGGTGGAGGVGGSGSGSSSGSNGSDGDPGTDGMQIDPTLPVVVDDTFTTSVNTALAVDPADLLLNDDLKGEAGTVTAVQPASAMGGTVFSSADFSGNILTIDYNPPAGFVGTDTFTYTVTTSAGSSTGTVTVTVTVI